MIGGKDIPLRKLLYFWRNSFMTPKLDGKFDG